MKKNSNLCELVFVCSKFITRVSFKLDWYKICINSSNWFNKN